MLLFDSHIICLKTVEIHVAMIIFQRYFHVVIQTLFLYLKWLNPVDCISSTSNLGH